MALVLFTSVVVQTIQPVIGLNGNTLDACGVCGGTGVDADSDGICDDVDPCVGQLDECGVCNGPGAIYECGCEDLVIFWCNNSNSWL